jgi:hypothetical protein
MKIFTMVGVVLLASVSLVMGQTGVVPPIAPSTPQQQHQIQKQQHIKSQMQILKQQDGKQRLHFKKPKDPSNIKFRCRYNASNNSYKCIKRNPKSK